MQSSNRRRNRMPFDHQTQWKMEEQQNCVKPGKTLEKLRVACTSVTSKGAKMAVQHLPALQVLEHEYFFEALIESGQSALDQHLPHIFNISYLFILPAISYKSGNLGLVASLCPFLIGVIVCVRERLADLFCLTTLKNLRSLKILKHPSSKRDEISFDMGIAPVLEAMGNSLNVLDLSFFSFVDIWTVIKFCPDLICLTFTCHESLSTLSDEEIIHLRKGKNRSIFKELKVLRCGYNLSSDLLFYLLSSPALEDVCISYCDALTDDFLRETFKFLPFQNLRELKLTHCVWVTKQGLDALMVDNNRISLVNINFCGKLLLTDLCDLYFQARHKNWKLHLHFKDSNFSV